LKLYSTISCEGCAEQTIEKSRFIAHAAPAATKEEADAFIERIRREYRDASHNVPAMVIGDKFQLQWGSDDGEPQGTSGAPIVQMLVQEGLTNLVVVVTRYFGGIKLGTGGLVRAYTSSAKIGVLAAKPCDVEEMSALTFKIDYKLFNRVQSHDFGGRAEAVDVGYAENVTFSMVCEPSDAEWCRSVIAGLTNGEAVLTDEASRLVQHKRP
jgi:uncharacterized YigZ family protein